MSELAILLLLIAMATLISGGVVMSMKVERARQARRRRLAVRNVREIERRVNQELLAALYRDRTGE